MSECRDQFNVGKPNGFIRAFSLDEGGNILQLIEKPNLIVYSGADVVARCLAWQELYVPRVIYFEFSNATPPTVSPTRADDSLSYYENLYLATGDEDYLRVPISVTPLTTSSDASKYDANVVTYYSLTAGTAGEGGGVTFSEAAGSKVYGAALVAAPDLNDKTKDVIMSRVYFSSSLSKGPAQVGIQWEIECL